MVVGVWDTVVTMVVSLVVGAAGDWGHQLGHVTPEGLVHELEGVHHTQVVMISVVHDEGSVHEVDGTAHELGGAHPMDEPNQSQPEGYLEGHELPSWSLV